MSAPSRSQVLSLYRCFLRTARTFSDYNIREYTKRRSADAFRQNSGLSDPSAATAAFADGQSQLEIAKRQAVVYHLYSPKIKSVMDVHA